MVAIFYCIHYEHQQRVSVIRSIPTQGIPMPTSLTQLLNQIKTYTQTIIISDDLIFA